MLMCRLTLTKNTNKCTCSHANKFATTQNENLSHLFLTNKKTILCSSYADTKFVAICESFEVLGARYYKSAVFRKLVKHRLECPSYFVSLSVLSRAKKKTSLELQFALQKKKHTKKLLKNLNSS